MMHPLLQNAVTSLELAFEDMEEGERRILSAVRNFAAGVQLLLKYRLVRLSDEMGHGDLLIRDKVRMAVVDGKLSFKPERNDTTISAGEIAKRYGDLGIPLAAASIQHLDALNRERNHLEHRHATKSPQELLGLVHNVMEVIGEFADTHLTTEPAELLGEDLWAKFLANKSVYNRELAACEETTDCVVWQSEIAANAWDAFSCQQCGSRLLKRTSHSIAPEAFCVVCRACGMIWTIEDIIGVHCEGFRRYTVYFEDDGLSTDMDVSLQECHQCAQNTMLVKSMICVACGARYPGFGSEAG